MDQRGDSFLRVGQGWIVPKNELGNVEIGAAFGSFASGYAMDPRFLGFL